MATGRLRVLHDPAVILLMLVVTALALYHETTLSLLRLWTSADDPTYSHGLLLLVVCAFLLYRRWTEASAANRLQPNLLALCLVLGSSFVWFLARLGNILIVEQLSLWFSIGFLLPSVVGWRAARAVCFPIGLMVFAIPVWEPLTPYLQLFTTRAVTLLVNLSSIPAVHEGSIILIPAGAFDVDLSCSGLSQFIVALMVAALYAHLNRLPVRTGAWLAAAAALVALVANTLRIYIVVVAGELTKMQHYLVHHHWNLGWVIFGIGIFVFILLANRWAHPNTELSSRPRSVDPGGARDFTNGRIGSLMRTTLLAVCALTLGPALAYAYRTEQTGMQNLQLRLPTHIGAWSVVPSGSGNYRPHFYGPDLEYDQVYRNTDDAKVYVYIAYYARQEQGKEAVYYMNKSYDGRQWRLLSERDRAGAAMLGTLKESRIRSQTGAQKLVQQWYHVGGINTGNDYLAKILSVWGTLKGNPTIAAVIVATDLGDDEAKAQALLAQFMLDFMEPIKQAIDKVATE